MKKISIVVPCYNEEKSVNEMYSRLRETLATIPQYDYEIIYSDDCSFDDTWAEIEKVCAGDPKVKGVHNIKNFGPVRNAYAAMCYATGDAVALLMGDLQHPPERLPEFVQYWEEGYHATIAIHKNTETRGLEKVSRDIYYYFIQKISHDRIIPYFNLMGLYDKRIIDVLNAVDDMQPYLPGLISEYGGRIKAIEVPQEPSRRGRSNQGFFKRYDYAMVGFTSHTKLLMRMATFVGFFIGVLSILVAIYFIVTKLILWDSYSMGVPTAIVGIFFLGATQLFFMGIMGEYILSINERSMKRPIVASDAKLNFPTEQEDGRDA
jgi:glycosyltransferase involved in cell wall biosynthesis